MAAPKGNKNAEKGKAWEQAIKRALARKAAADGIEDVTFHGGLNAIADKVVNAAVEGQQWAIKEVGERIDGKPSQIIDMNVTDMTHEEALDLLEHGSISPERHTTH